MEKKFKLYDSGIFIGYMSSSGVKKELKSGFIKKVKGFKNIYQTDINYLKNRAIKTKKVVKILRDK